MGAEAEAAERAAAGAAALAEGPAATRAGESRPRASLLAVLPALLAYLALRAAVLAGGFDSTCQPVFELALGGDVAHLWLEALRGGAGGPPAWFAYDNAGGQLVDGLAALPLFAAFGQSYLVLKLVPILVGAAMLVVVHALLAERAGPRAAQLGAWLLALGPPTLVQLSTMALGSHFEALLPMSLCYLLWWRWLDEPSSRAHAFGFGLAAGFAVFLYFGALLLLALLAAAQLVALGPWRALRELARSGAGLVGGLVLGLAPLLAIELGSGRPAGFLAHNFDVLAHPDWVRWGVRARHFALAVLPRAATCDALGPLPGALGDALALLGAGLVWLLVASALPARLRAGGAARVHAAALLPLVGWLPGVFCVHVLSRLDFRGAGPPLEAMGYRYLAAHFWSAALLAGFVAAGLPAARGARRALSVCALACALGVLPFSLALVGRDETGLAEGLAYPGWHLPLFGPVVGREAWAARQADDTGLAPPLWETERVLPWLEQLPAGEREAVLLGLGNGVGYSPRGLTRGPGEDPSAWLPRAPALLFDAWPDEHRPALRRGLGSALGRRVRVGRVESARARAWLVEQERLDAKVAGELVEGLPLDIAFPLRTQRGRRLEGLELLVASVPESLRTSFARGLGRAAGMSARDAGEQGELERVATRSGRELERVAFAEGLAAGRSLAGAP